MERSLDQENFILGNSQSNFVFMSKGDVLTLSNVGVKEREVEEWREKEFQQNLYEVLRDQRKDFYQIL